MKINGLRPVYFDIETEGFSAWEDDFICAANCETYGEGGSKTGITQDCGEVMDYYEAFDFMRRIVVSYNGENYRGGFDFPWLRSKCIQKGISWRLSGVKHLDLLPLVRKYINTTGYEPPSKSDLYADDLKRLAEANDIEYSNKSQAYEELEELEEVDWLDYVQEPNEDNSLQSVYQKLFDPEKEEEYISGEKIPELYGKYKETSDEYYIDEIFQHNKRDVERLKKVAEAVIPVIPDWEIKRNINKL